MKSDPEFEADIRLRRYKAAVELIQSYDLITLLAGVGRLVHEVDRALAVTRREQYDNVTIVSRAMTP